MYLFQYTWTVNLEMKHIENRETEEADYTENWQSVVVFYKGYRDAQVHTGSLKYSGHLET